MAEHVGNEQKLEAAVAAAIATPTDEGVWDEIEDLAGALDRPDDVAAAYEEVLQQELPAELILALGKRAADFCDEWFGDDPARLARVLARVLDVDPKAEWAFQRLTVAYTNTGRFDELLALYDRALAATKDQARQVRLLDEAAQVAKDVANAPDKAIDYLQRLVPLAPDDAQLAQALERLLERHERWRDLIALWEAQLAELTGADREASRARIASCWLDNLDEPGRALGAVRPLLAEAGDDAEACRLLERIATASSADAQVRQGALDLLRSHYEATGRGRDIVRVLETVIELVDARERAGLHEEAGERLADLGDHAGAMRHYAALLALDPASSVTQEKLRQIAELSSSWDAYARGVAEAAAQADDVARRVALLAEAARTRLDLLEDEAGAIELYQQALAQEGISEGSVRQVARRLNELLARADRPAERLVVLERLMQVETTAANRRAVVGEAARVAQALGDADRALAAWQQRIDADPNDLDALDAIISLLEGQARWEPLLEALEQRIARSASEPQRRADLARIATVWHRELDRVDQAITAWRRYHGEFGESPETVDALADLLALAERWPELSELLERASDREARQVTERLIRLADVRAGHLGAPEAALGAYRSVVLVEPAHEQALAGLTALLDRDDTRAAAADALAHAYRKTKNWPGLLGLVDARLSAAGDATERLQILREAAAVQERELDDRAGAARSLAACVPLAPRDQVLQQHLIRLARETGLVAEAARALREAAEAVAAEPHEVARLRFDEARLQEADLDDADAAHQGYFAVIGIDPGNLVATAGVTRLGSRLGRWSQVAAALIGYGRARQAIDADLVAEMETVAGGTGAWDPMVSALAEALADAEAELPAPLAAHLWQRLGGWHRDQRDDAAAARAAFERCLAVGGPREDVLRALAALQRETPTRAYFDTLRRLVDVVPRDLDVAWEAAEVAVGQLDDAEVRRSALTDLLGRASAAWRGNTEVDSTRPPESAVAWALGQLVDMALADERPQAAVDLLVDSSRLPFDGDTRRSMRIRAAQIAAERMGDTSIAIEMYRGVLNQNPHDTEAMDLLGELYAKEERFAELLALRQHQLALADDADRKLSLRLEVAALVGEVERRGGRVEALRANLHERPGHEPSIDALATLLDDLGKHALLADILEEQATRLEALDQGERAADLWARLATVAEQAMRDSDRAIAAHRRVVALTQSVASLSAMARLFVERGQPAQAVPWIERRLALTDASARDAVALELANAHLQADQQAQAIAALEANLPEDRAATELRSLLIELYRKSQSWAPLASLLTRSLRLVDEKQAVELAREAASIYRDRAGSSAEAIPALEMALSLDPEDRGLRIQLAIALREAGRLEEARALLQAIIKEFGRRRTAERATAHVQLGLVAQAEGNTKEALEQLEMAARMDQGNAAIQKLVGDMARDSGNLDKAEQTYRALLLVVRRQPPGDDESAVGVSEVLYDLHRIAAQRDDADQAKELLESAIQAAVQSDAEVHRLRRALMTWGESETLLQVLRMRLEVSEAPKSRAGLLADIAGVLDGPLDRPAEALDALLQAIELVPDRIELHEAARGLAVRTGGVERYADAVNTAIDRLRRKEDPPLMAGLLLSLGACLESAGLLARALESFKRVEQLGERVSEALLAIARIAGALGDEDERTRALDELLVIANADDASPAQIDAQYRLANVFVGDDERRERGLKLLEQAFDAEPRHAVAAEVLRRAADAEPDDAAIIALYERVARSSGDLPMLLDFLERRARLSGASPNEIKEAVDVAVEAGEPERGQALLERAVQAARDTVDGVAGAIWAVVALAQQRMRSGKLASARDLWAELADVAEPAQVEQLGLQIAQRAVDADEGALAAEILEHLRQRDPGKREIWEPLLGLYRRAGDGDRLQDLVQSTLPTLVDPVERNAMRLQHARYLIEDLDRAGDAAEILRDALLDDPDQLEVAGLLEHVLRTLGDRDGLTDFLWQRFEEARERRNPDTVIDVAWRLGALLDETGSSEAATVYRAALEIAPESVALLRALLDRLDEDADPSERAALMERLLRVETEPGAAVALTNTLASLREELEDLPGVQRALELGHRSVPEDAGIHQRLEEWYRGHGLWAPLSKLMIDDARRALEAEQLAAAVARFREAASIWRDTIGDAGSAVPVLREALQAAPADAQLVVETAACQAAAGDRDGALVTLGSALDEHVTGPERVELLLLRADLYRQLEDDGGAIDDLEEAFGLARERAYEPLVEAHEERRRRAGDRMERAEEREATLRLVALLGGIDGERARELLSAWVEREAADREALHLLLDMDSAAERWDGVLATCARLVLVEEGQAQIDAAVRLARAAETTDRAADALPGLEHVHRAQPDSEVIRDYLRRLYELSGAHRELAGILLADADHGSDPDARYAAYRRAAELLVYQLGDLETAARAAGGALELRPGDHDALILHVDVLIASQRIDEAVAVLEPAIGEHKRRSPELATLQQRMAHLAAIAGDRDTQLAWLKKAFDVDRKSGEIAAELAQLATEMGDYDLALKPLRAITLMDDPQPITRVMALLWEAKIEHARGNKAKAELWAKKALREDPEFAEAQQFLDEIAG